MSFSRPYILAAEENLAMRSIAEFWVAALVRENPAALGRGPRCGRRVPESCVQKDLGWKVCSRASTYWPCHVTMYCDT